MASRPDLKVDDEVGFVKWFRGLPAIDDDTIRVFDRDGFFSCHGPDAIFVAQTVYKSVSVVKQLGRSPGLDSVTMSNLVFRGLLREALFRLGKRIQVWENTGRGNWKVTKQVRVHDCGERSRI